jgi:hypothetical protein
MKKWIKVQFGLNILAILIGLMLWTVSLFGSKEPATKIEFNLPSAAKMGKKAGQYVSSFLNGIVNGLWKSEK